MWVMNNPRIQGMSPCTRAAASVIHGGHANGLKAWKNEKGFTLKELEQKEMAIY
jgi:hypothetical protein